jgi:hypothetical protein
MSGDSSGEKVRVGIIYRNTAQVSHGEIVRCNSFSDQNAKIEPGRARLVGNLGRFRGFPWRLGSELIAR